tara:strand:+ start:28891 stop:29490 length:600 start_codon:yes stop_codon:yes gene_type:complete
MSTFMNNTKPILNKIYCLLVLIVVLSSCKENKSKLVSQVTIPATSRVIEGVVIENKTAADTTKVKHLEGKIIRILDGDTVEVLYGQLPIKVRLEHIDAPEKRGKQPFGNKAKIAMSNLCFGQTVAIYSDGKFDRNGRLIGVIFTKEGLNVNKEMVRLGMAWHFKKYSDDMSYDALEKEAREAKVGLWIDPNPIAPWNFR